MSTEGALLTLLDVAIEATNHAKKLSFILPAAIIFGTVNTILTMIKVCFLFCDDEASRAHV